MPYFPQNRCYVYSYIPSTCVVCRRSLIRKEYYISSKKRKLIRYQGEYCPNCSAFFIKYGTYNGQKKHWIVLNEHELQMVASMYKNEKKHTISSSTVKNGVIDNSSSDVFHNAPGLSNSREEKHVSRNKAAKGRKAREEREKEKKDQIKKRLELKEAQRIKQLQEFEKKREKEYQRRLAESRARHAAKVRGEETENQKADEAVSTPYNAGKTTVREDKKSGITNQPGSSSADMRKDLISRGIIIVPEKKRSSGPRPSNLKNRDGDYIITAHDFVVRRAVFKCMHNNHQIEDIKAVFTTISRLGTVNKITIPAGYCSTCNMYFIMESTYNRIKKSGIPICRTMDEKNYLKSNTTGIYYNGLASESVLMQFGYTVSKQDDLPAEQRRRILAAIVDNDVLKRNEVVSYLDYFINQRKNQKNKDGSLRYKDAIDKWRADRAWINQYKLGSYKEVVIGSIVTGKE